MSSKDPSLERKNRDYLEEYYGKPCAMENHNPGHFCSEACPFRGTDKCGRKIRPQRGDFSGTADVYHNFPAGFWGNRENCERTPDLNKFIKAIQDYWPGTEEWQAIYTAFDDNDDNC